MYFSNQDNERPDRGRDIYVGRTCATNDGHSLSKISTKDNEFSTEWYSTKGGILCRHEISERMVHRLRCQGLDGERRNQQTGRVYLQVVSM